MGWRGLLAAMVLAAAQVSVGADAAGPAPEAAAVQPAVAHEAAAAVVGDPVRGRYLAEHVAMCVECHSGRDAQGNIIPSELYMGGNIPTKPAWPNDWAIRAPRNSGLPGYTVEDGIRLLTEGAIDRTGRQLKSPMPKFRMTRQDAADVVAFLKSLP